MTETTTRRLRLAELNARGLYDTDGAAVIIEDLTDGDSRPVASVTCQSLYKRGQGRTARCDERDALAALFIAAPSMYETLLAIEDMTVNCAGVPTNPDSLPQMVLHEVRAAIAKATGAKP